MTPTLSQYFIHGKNNEVAPRDDLSEKDKLLAAEEAALSGRFRRVIECAATIEIETAYEEVRPGGPLNISMKVNGNDVASGQVPISAPLLFSANDCLDIGICLGGRVCARLLRPCPLPLLGPGRTW